MGIVSGQCRPQIRVNEIITFVEQRLALLAGERVAEAVAEVQVGAMSAAFSVVAVSLAGDSGLLCGDGLDYDTESVKEIVDLAAHDSISPAVNDNGKFKISGRRDIHVFCIIQDCLKKDPLRFIPQ